MKYSKIFQVQGNASTHYVNAGTKEQAIALAKEVWPAEFINFAADVTNSHFTQDEINNLPEYVIIYDKNVIIF